MKIPLFESIKTFVHQDWEETFPLHRWLFRYPLMLHVGSCSYKSTATAVSHLSQLPVIISFLLLLWFNCTDPKLVIHFTYHGTLALYWTLDINYFQNHLKTLCVGIFQNMILSCYGLGFLVWVFFPSVLIFCFHEYWRYFSCFEGDRLSFQMSYLVTSCLLHLI